MRAVKVRFCSKRQINKTKQKMRNKRLAFDWWNDRKESTNTWPNLKFQTSRLFCIWLARCRRFKQPVQKTTYLKKTASRKQRIYLLSYTVNIG
jgi:hypothetical protein